MSMMVSTSAATASGSATACSFKALTSSDLKSQSHQPKIQLNKIISQYFILIFFFSLVINNSMKQKSKHTAQRGLTVSSTNSTPKPLQKRFSRGKKQKPRVDPSTEMPKMPNMPFLIILSFFPIWELN